MDGATAEVVVPLRVATEGLPAICAMTGNVADGAMPMRVGRSIKRWSSPQVRIPLSDHVFTRWSRRQNIHIKARGLASLLTAVGVVIAFRNATIAVMVLIVAIAVHLLDLWAERGAKDAQPVLERQGSDLKISGVHANFVDAVADSQHWK